MGKVTVLMKNILILGFGISGQAAARLAVFKGYSVTVLDEKTPVVPDKYSLIAKWTPAISLPKFDVAVISPGISIYSPMAEAVRATETPIIGELEFAAADLPCKIVAITGTNGKTTTTELTTDLIQSAGFRCESAGNIGTALSDVALELQQGKRKLDVLVVETSSFQLESMEHYAPFSAAFLNLASDHINRHGSMEGYADAKFRLFRKISRSEKTCVINRNLLPDWKEHYPTEIPATFSTETDADFHLKGDVLCFRGKFIFDWKKCPLEGRHNIENVLAALALLRSVAGDEILFSESVRQTLSGFAPDKHRLECFAEKNGIRYIDDSKATNPHSVNAALQTVGGKHNVILILGGSDKAMDFSCIAKDSDKIKHAIINGHAGARIEEDLKNALSYTRFETFDEAVKAACEKAVPGDVVLLSPACASFDFFSGYKARGNRFQELVNSYLNRNAFHFDN